ncbi:hypothetical protein R3P38DRAFT_3200302 [Favolaschia claudopus]|uniref:Uncharacterized protein n=1 Tax=Favolaschia claudopus TaxID=2862362 RepID=A0AAW0B1Q6_9AGAR
MRRIINPDRVVRRPPRKAGARIPPFEIQGLDRSLDLEPHLDFDFKERLQHALALGDPSLPYPGLPLPEELPPPPAPGYADAQVQTESTVTRVVTQQALQRSKAVLAAERAKRHRNLWSAAMTVRYGDLIRPFNPRSLIRVMDGEAFDPSLIEDRDYPLSEVTGSSSIFHFRLIPWTAGKSRAVVSQRRVCLVLGGRPTNREWDRDVVNPTLRDCRRVAEDYRSRHPEAGYPVLSGGVGEHFNRSPEPPAGPQPGRVLDCLALFALLSTVAMCELLGFANGMLRLYCRIAYTALEHQKSSFTYMKPDAQYPCPASIFSAVTVELGGPHCRTDWRGEVPPYQPDSWAVLTAIGDYRYTQGGHVIFWEFGIVVQFPPGACILLPPGLVRYSFVEVPDHQSRHSILQWAGSGIERYLHNRDVTDSDFARFATEAEHDEREARRHRDHITATEFFPRPEHLEEEWQRFSYLVGPNPPPGPDLQLPIPNPTPAANPTLTDAGAASPAPAAN